ncbi:Xylose isomerase domain protein TIM barrel [uncultured spirochete]|uniref:Xylose isomerase domain protein TIM barrel n=1 Tax=uncultured spirochete TaxID=156406 RepID=A0A3P3XR81_9SPIR|nr:Xylose isomerase domain protein TIM barrel [uncultured spirochete]
MVDTVNRYSFSTAALYPRSASESLRLIAGAGFPHAELMPQCFADASESFAREAERIDIHVASVHYPLAMFSMLYNASPGMVAEARAFGVGLVRLCKLLGAEVLVIHPHEVQQDPRLKELIEHPIRGNILHLAEQCDKAGVLLVMENSPKGVGRTPEGLLSYIESLGAPLVRPAVDTTESCESDIDPAEFIKKAHPAHLHLSDHSGDKKHIPAGEGDTNWRAVAAALDACGYGGYYTLEPLYRYYLDNPEEKLARAHAFISGLIGD